MLSPCGSLYPIISGTLSSSGGLPHKGITPTERGFLSMGISLACTICKRFPVERGRRRASGAVRTKRIGTDHSALITGQLINFDLTDSRAVGRGTPGSTPREKYMLGKETSCLSFEIHDPAGESSAVAIFHPVDAGVVHDSASSATSKSWQEKSALHRT